MPKKKSATKWFEPGRHTGWSKSDGQATRRRTILKSRQGNYLKCARALQALANVTTDSETRRKAHSDAIYFYRMHAKTGK
jgi:hypothetical protein